MATGILGIDPGLTRCGWGMVRRQGTQLRLVDVGVIRTASQTPLPLRLLAVTEELEALIARLRPEVVAVERVFAQHNLHSVTGTAQVAGLALVAAARLGLPVAVHTPTEVKAAVTGYGKADKAQVAEMVRRLLGLEVAPSPADAADALALAITHAWRPALASATAQSAAQQRWAQALAASRA